MKLRIYVVTGPDGRSEHTSGVEAITLAQHNLEECERGQTVTVTKAIRDDGGAVSDVETSFSETKGSS